MLHNGAGVELVDGDKPFLFKIILNTQMGIEAAVWNIKIAAHEAGNFDAVAFHFLVVDAVIANMDVGGYQNLSCIRRVGKNFLITRHTRIETNFAGSRTGFAGGFAVKYCAVFKE